MNPSIRMLLLGAVAICGVSTAHAQRGFYAKKTLPWSSYVAPAVRWFNCKLYIAWTGTDHSINIASAADGQNFSNPVRLAEYSWVSPALAADQNGTLYLAWTGTDYRLNIMSSADGRNFGNKITLNEYSYFAPGLAAGSSGGVRYWSIGWTGTDSANHLNVLTSRGGSPNYTKLVLPASSSAGPALADFSGTLYIAWTLGTSIHVGLPVSDRYAGARINNEVTLPSPEFSYNAPALAFVPDHAGTIGYTPRLYVGWTGTDSSLNVNSSGAGLAFSDRIRLTILNDTSYMGDGPALERDANCITNYLASPEGAFVAWTGSDSAHHLNVGKIHAVEFAWR